MKKKVTQLVTTINYRDLLKSINQLTIATDTQSN